MRQGSITLGLRALAWMWVAAPLACSTGGPPTAAPGGGGATPGSPGYCQGDLVAAASTQVWATDTGYSPWTWVSDTATPANPGAASSRWCLDNPVAANEGGEYGPRDEPCGWSRSEVAGSALLEACSGAGARYFDSLLAEHPTGPQEPYSYRVSLKDSGCRMPDCGTGEDWPQCDVSVYGFPATASNTVGIPYLPVAVLYQPMGGGAATPSRVTYADGGAIGTNFSVSASVGASIGLSSICAAGGITGCSGLNADASLQPAGGGSITYQPFEGRSVTYPRPNTYSWNGAVVHDPNADAVGFLLGVQDVVVMDACQNVHHTLDFSDSRAIVIPVGCLTGAWSWGTNGCGRNPFVTVNPATGALWTSAEVGKIALADGLLPGNQTVDGARYAYLGAYYQVGSNFFGSFSWGGLGLNLMGHVSTIRTAWGEGVDFAVGSHTMATGVTFESTSTATDRRLPATDVITLSYFPTTNYDALSPLEVWVYWDTIYDSVMISRQWPCDASNGDGSAWYPVPGYPCGSGTAN